MAELTVGMTYGNALFQVASEVHKTEVILDEAIQLLELLKQEQDLSAFIDTPVISIADKKDVLKSILEGRISEELLNFLYVMIDKGRTKHFERAIKVYKELLDKEEGLAYGKIFSVKPLSADKLQKFEKETGKLLQEKVKLENEIDTNLIGGIKILIDGKVIDASLRKRLEDLSNTII
ncbi:ATP synthase F1 subunit delta [Aminipila luticellarii]|uniref:ATP synthase subunit delta n=1 Tax=Aminipila luticellarii TaxID=2507160 RepID=A0A410PYH4_9FIRM|nr:ATP synthase F1 subunit delta [Aminipila luticellarii]QAT43886.1 ATP synthase F1 subunit delta [Aminipila luticellarii]